MNISKPFEQTDTAINDAEKELKTVTEQASAMAHRGVDAMRDSSVHVRETAKRMSDETVNYIKGDPVKSMLIAAATGAVLMAMVSLMSSTRNR
jgi:ElaB/YqjD/DUF883 family membrane-anchored ribosome-binding protein